jgi:hypothetical protein
MPLLPGLCCACNALLHLGSSRNLHAVEPEGNRWGKSAAMPGSGFGLAAAGAAGGGPPGPTGL